MEIGEFVKARLDEDEVAAKAWQSPPWREDATNWRVAGQREPRYDNGRSETLTVIDVSGRAVDFAEAIQVKWDSNGERAEHIARHDPARVLREVAAKRKRLALMIEATAEMDKLLADEHAGDVARAMAIGRARAATVGVKIDAEIWHGHPDYNAKWKP